MLSSAIFTVTIVALFIPLAVLAGFTSTIAFLGLLLRAILVYAELGAILVRSHLFFRPPSNSRVRRPKFTGNAPVAQHHHEQQQQQQHQQQHQQQQQQRRRHRTISQASSLEQSFSRGDSGDADSVNGPLERPASVRDFEGVGGWRFLGTEEDDTQWTLLNSRLELPATSERKRRHRRSLTSSSMQSPPAGNSRRHRKQSSETSTLSTSGSASAATHAPAASDFPSSRSVPNLESHPGAGGSLLREGASVSSSASSSRTSSRGSQLLTMKHSVRD